MNNSQLSRRSILFAPCATALVGCSENSLIHTFSGLNQNSSITLLTSSWSDNNLKSLSSSFSDWSNRYHNNPIRIRWIKIPENELQRLSASALLQSAHGIFGGFSDLHNQLPVAQRETFPLRPHHKPVVLAPNSSQSITPSSKPNLALSGLSNLTDPNAWPVRELPLQLNDPATDALSRAYSLAIFDNAPDQAAGYARWIRLTKSLSTRSIKSPSSNAASLGLAYINDSDSSQFSTWRGGTKLNNQLMIASNAPLHWPECVTLWHTSPDLNAPSRLLRSFLTSALDILIKTPPAPKAQSTARPFLTDIASVILHDCTDQLQNAWKVIVDLGGENQARSEKYLTERPPWPPASIQDLQKKRGFEYVVALVEQIASTGDQRDWLIQEFQKPPEPINFNILDKALNHQLSSCVRFRSWLRAEWRAWVNQRCRRVERFLIS